jgi:hydroxypyruvate isomerase
MTEEEEELTPQQKERAHNKLMKETQDQCNRINAKALLMSVNEIRNENSQIKAELVEVRKTLARIELAENKRLQIEQLRKANVPEATIKQFEESLG